MKHLGDITKIHGDQIEPVDCITFGSPCQDLSIAGRRAGLAGERSGLFMEAVRIIKEMRSSTNGLYPTFAVWENVPGAFSSNGGEDFRAVLEELARVEQPDASIPRPPKSGRWSKAGAIVGNGWIHNRGAPLHSYIHYYNRAAALSCTASGVVLVSGTCWRCCGAVIRSSVRQVVL